MFDLAVAIVLALASGLLGFLLGRLKRRHQTSPATGPAVTSPCRDFTYDVRGGGHRPVSDEIYPGLNFGFGARYHLVSPAFLPNRSIELAMQAVRMSMEAAIVVMNLGPGKEESNARKEKARKAIHTATWLREGIYDPWEPRKKVYQAFINAAEAMLATCSPAPVAGGDGEE